MGDCVVCEVDRAVGQGLDEVLLVEGQLGAKAERSGAAPLSQPVNGVHQLVLQDLAVGFEVLGDMVKNSLLPLLISVVDVPLVDAFHHTDISCP